MPERDGLYALEKHLPNPRLVDFQQADGMPVSEETSIQCVIDTGEGRAVEGSSKQQRRVLMIYR
jgi:hypothetical protein